MKSLTRPCCLLVASLLTISLAKTPNLTKARQTATRGGLSSRQAEGRTPGTIVRGGPKQTTNPTIGDYPDTAVQLSANATVTPSDAPTGATRINVATSTDFKGRLEGNPTTGAVRVTDAHPAGTYAVTITAFDNVGATTTATFALTVTTPATCNPVSFRAPELFPTQSFPDSVAVGDFNGDGEQDFAVVNRGSNSVSILLGDGSGDFIAPTPGSFSVGLAPRSVAVGDFNSDGHEDLAVANQFSNHVSVLLGNGSGGFSPAPPVGVGNGTFGVAVGDFDGDGRQDLVALKGDLSSDNVIILSGNGSGGFVAAGTHTAGNAPIFVAVGDFDRDGDQDLAVDNLNSTDVSILVGTDGLGFEPAINFGSGGDAESVAIGNFDAGGDQDLAVAFFGSNDVWVWMGGANASFSGPGIFGVGSAPIEVAVGDFNGDGLQDLVSANQNTDNVSILLGKGDGTFHPAANFGAGINPRTLAVGDFNGDGLQDLVTTNLNSSGVSVLLRQCPAKPGDLLISEFRLRGPGADGVMPSSDDAFDEFVEIYNNTNAPHTVRTTDGSAGYAIVTQDGIKRCTIPANVTTIPARGHFLCVNSGGYSPGAYPAGDVTTATGDATYTGDIPDNTGIALFNSATDFSLLTRIDAVGFNTSPPLYKEGAGLPPLTSFSIDYAFVRDECGKSGSMTTFGPCPSGGNVVDRDNNAADLFFVDTNGAGAGAGQRLGAPGPQNLSSPIQRNGSFGTALLDPCTSSSSPPNRVRNTVADPAHNATFGTLEIRRTLTNTTIPSATRLRFRIIDVTTFPAPSGIADLRAQTSPDLMVFVSQCGSGTGSVLVRGTTLEEPPTQPKYGAFNSSLSVIPLAPPLPMGGSINVRFVFGIEQTGLFKVYVNIEALP